ncbi:Fibrinogen-like protein A [Holothuria leucospilota]|uniref:Fibrinogen-like protein A n=1 Tax=Holothuria leucospilota TaxID=206669 RepID=A0A9Q1H4Y0_HOLLE|nr:Fibrinogen-like protein A [Holothuria leucospilota]
MDLSLSACRYIFLLVVGVCTILFDSLSAERNVHSPSDSTIKGHGSSFFVYQKPQYPRDCSEVRDSCSSSLSSGVYLIKPDGYEEPFEAYCDNDMDSGGWTVILRRFNGSLSFDRNWNDYQNGFGFLSAEFWLGHDKISYLTNQAVYGLQTNVTFDNGTSCDMKHDAFRIGDGWSNYTVSSVGAYHSDSACRWTERYNPTECDPNQFSTTFTDCDDVYTNNYNNRRDGVYCIRPAGWTDPPFKVFCNMSIDGGRWTGIVSITFKIRRLVRTMKTMMEEATTVQRDIEVAGGMARIFIQAITFAFILRVVAPACYVHILIRTVTTMAVMERTYSMSITHIIMTAIKASLLKVQLYLKNLDTIACSNQTYQGSTGAVSHQLE